MWLVRRLLYIHTAVPQEALIIHITASNKLVYIKIVFLWPEICMSQF